MKPSVQNFKSDQPKKLSKREDKRKVNHKWNSRLFFQIGLVVSLIVTTLVMESTIGLSVMRQVVAKEDPMMDPPTIVYELDKDQPVVVEKVKEVKRKPVVQQKIIKDKIAVVDNKVIIKETPLATKVEPKVVITPPVNKSTPDVKTTADNVNTVEFVPVFPGCEKLASNDERKQCLSDKIRAFVSRKFDTEEFSYMDSGKTFRISVEFKIDATGNVTDIRSRAPEKSLENEAIRVINQLPLFKPGMQGDRPVDVLYRIPITFQTN